LVIASFALCCCKFDPSIWINMSLLTAVIQHIAILSIILCLDRVSCEAC
jgi:hypothetical protein